MTIQTMTMAELKAEHALLVEHQKKAKSALFAVEGEIKRRLAPLANDYGTFDREVDGVAVKVVKSKNIAWDGDKLAELYDQIVADGADPSVYIKRKVELSIAENTYKAWSDDTKAVFDVARTEKEPKFTFEFVDEA